MKGRWAKLIEKQNVRNKKSVAKLAKWMKENPEKRRTYQREYRRKYIAKRLAAGLCERCGKKRSTCGKGNKNFCPDCREKRRIARLPTDSGRIQIRLLLGLCIRCERKLTDTKRLCNRCLLSTRIGALGHLDPVVDVLLQSEHHQRITKKLIAKVNRKLGRNNHVRKSEV